MKLKPVTMRVPEDRLKRVDDRAKAAGLSRTQYMLDRADPEGAPKRVTTPENMTSPTTGCVHPRSARKQLGWGTVCVVELGGCGTKIG